MSPEAAAIGTVGQAVRRLDGISKVTGEATYTDDIFLPGMLWGKTLRSPHASARIVSIDATRAKSLAGVHAVLTSTDVPDTRYGRLVMDVPILARGRVRFVGEKVAVIAAESAEIAESALSLIDIEYDELPAVFDAQDAMQNSAPRVHDGPSNVSAGVGLGVHGELRMFPSIPNVISQFLVRHGDSSRAFSQAHRVFEHTFTIPSVHQGYIEPHACVVAVDAAGLVDVWIANKSPHVARAMMAEAINLPIERVRFNPVTIGGDFGGKGSLMDAVVCYCLAERTGRPVKMVMDYFEELTAANPRHAAAITLRSAVDRKHQLLAMDAKIIFNAGAYAGFCPVATLHGYVAFAGPYKVENCTIEALRVYSNTVPAGHMRSPGGPQITFAVETHLDMIAHELHIDPFEFRRDNAIMEGDLSPIGERRRFLRSRAVIEAAMKKVDFTSPKEPNVGRGIGVYEYPPGTFGRSTVTITIAGDGKIRLVTGAADNGNGFHTIVWQLVADHFRVPLDDVEVVQGDTSTSGFDTGPSGARLTTTIGQAINAAAEKTKTTLKQLAAEHIGCDPSEVRIEPDGSLSGGGKSVGLKPLMSWAGSCGKAPISHEGQNTPNSPDDITCFTAQIAEVEVDPETGQVRVRRIITSHDVGKVINPITHQGQIDGGVVQSLGQAMSEHLIHRDGAVVTATMGEYKLPTIMDIPELETVLVPHDGPHRDVAKAIGEMSNTAIAPAIANAVYDAVGVRLMELPISAEKIYNALRAKANEP